MFCPYCGTDLADARFCLRCETSVPSISQIQTLTYRRTGHLASFTKRGAAILSFILGGFSLFYLRNLWFLAEEFMLGTFYLRTYVGALSAGAAIVLGHIAWTRVLTSVVKRYQAGLALSGLLMGYVSLVTTLVVVIFVDRHPSALIGEYSYAFGDHFLTYCYLGGMATSLVFGFILTFWPAPDEENRPSALIAWLAGVFAPTVIAFVSGFFAEIRGYPGLESPGFLTALGRGLMVLLPPSLYVCMCCSPVGAGLGFVMGRFACLLQLPRRSNPIKQTAE